MPGSAGRASRSPEDVLLSVCWTVMGIGFVGVALVGAVVSGPSTVLLVGPVCGALMAGMVALTVDGPLQHPRNRRLQIGAAAAGLLFIPFLAGTVLMGVLGAAVAIALLALGTVAAVVRTGSGGRRPPPRWDERTEAESPPRRPIPMTPTVELVPLMQTSKLLQEWHSSSARLVDPDALRRLQTVRLREALLDELFRRHPEAVDRWLRHQDGEDLQRRIGEDPDVAA